MDEIKKRKEELRRDEGEAEEKTAKPVRRREKKEPED
jgi:hypothetical protein